MYGTIYIHTHLVPVFPIRRPVLCHGVDNVDISLTQLLIIQVIYYNSDGVVCGVCLHYLMFVRGVYAAQHSGDDASLILPEYLLQ